MRADEAKRSLISAWRAACEQVSPSAIFSRHPQAFPSARSEPGTAVLAWGKASGAVMDALQPETPYSLAIVPEGAEPPRTLVPWIRGGHPLPNEGSFAAGEALLRFFDELRRGGVRKLRIYLSGGASSSAWVPQLGCALSEVRAEAQALYRSGWNIRRVNEARSRLCALKGGGAARWLRRLSPGTGAQVWVLSDVWPYGMDVVGSGPFHDGRIPHHLLAANPDFVQALSGELARRFARGARSRVLRSESAHLEDWRKLLVAHARKRRTRPELLLLGGEPVLSLRRHPGRGGRMTHLALLLYRDLQKEISAGRVLGLCASSDGRDGLSRSAGSLLLAESARALSQKEIRASLEKQDSASLLARAGALLPQSPTGTNLQDAVALLLRP